MSLFFPFPSPLPEATQITHRVMSSSYSLCLGERNSSRKRSLFGSHLANICYSLLTAQHFCMKEGLGEAPFLGFQRSMLIVCRVVHFWGDFSEEAWWNVVGLSLFIGKENWATPGRKIPALILLLPLNKPWCSFSCLRMLQKFSLLGFCLSTKGFEENIR